MARPRCPQCGEPARVALIIIKARVRCELQDDGTLGKVLSMSREPSPIAGYECGGRHSWAVKP